MNCQTDCQTILTSESGKMDNTLLNRFYDDHVKMIRDETSQNIEIVIPIVKEILQYVHSKDRRFKSQPINVGSYYTHLKVSRADEFDFSVVLDIPQLDWCSDDSDRNYGFDKKNEIVRTRMKLRDPPIGKCFISDTGIIRKWNREGINEGPACLTIDDDIIPILVKNRFKTLVGKAVEEQPNIREYVNAKRLSESPATTLIITHSQIAGDSVSVDLTPMIESCSRFRKTFGWPRPTSQWPSEKKIEKLRSIGVNDIAKDAFYWTYSFASCEKELLEGIDTKDTCRKKSQKIMKKLKESWCPEGVRKGLTSYHLKNVLFWECEDHPHNYEWSDDNLATRLRSMCNRLLEYIQEENLPQYFHPRVNLFSTKDIAVLYQVARNIQTFFLDPARYLKKHY